MWQRDSKCSDRGDGASSSRTADQRARRARCRAGDRRAAGGAMSEGKVTLPEIDPASATGNIITAGSSTVFPLTQRMAEKFKDEGYTGNITVDSIGTGAGFERFCKAGETDIANASRAIKKEEIANCAKLSPARTPVEFRVGTDALAVVVSKENTFADNLTKAQLADIFSGKASHLGRGQPGLAEGEDPALQPRHRQRHLRLLRRGDYDRRS